MRNHILCTACIWLAAIVVSAQNLDYRLMQSLNVNRPKGLDKEFLAVTRSVGGVTAAVPFTQIGIGLQTGNRDLWQEGIETFGASAAAIGLTVALKKITDRPRPYLQYNDLDPVLEASGNSFPSGHAALAFATATSLSLNHRKWYVVVPVYTWATGVAYSRVHLGVHYVSDVVAGAALGTGTAWLAYKLRRKVFAPDRGKDLPPVHF